MNYQDYNYIMTFVIIFMLKMHPILLFLIFDNKIIWKSGQHSEKLNVSAILMLMAISG